MKMSNIENRPLFWHICLYLIVISYFVLIESMGSYLLNLESGVWALLDFVKIACFAIFNAVLVITIMSVCYSYCFLALFILVSIYAIFAYANLLHFRGLNTYLPLMMITETNQLNGLWNSIWGLVRWYDILYLLVVIFFICLYRYVRLKSTKVYRFNIIRHFAILFVIWIITISAFVLVNKTMGLRNNQEIKEYITLNSRVVPQSTYKTLGLIPIIYYQINNEFNLSNEDSIDSIQNNLIDEIIQKNLSLNNNDTLKCLRHNKNVVIMLMESFNTACISPEVMPVLSELCNLSTTLYCPKTKQLTQGAMSIGGQLVTLSGLNGLISSPFCSMYPYNEYPSIARELRIRDKNAYSFIVVSTDTLYWRQNQVAASLGFNAVFGKESGMTKFNRSGWGDDKEVFELAKRKIRDLSVPFCSVIVPSNMHVFYTKDETIDCDVTFSHLYDEECHEYMRRARYLDEQIGSFVDFLKDLGIYDETLIVITSDHQVPMKYCSVELKRHLSPYFPTIYINACKNMTENNNENLDIVFSHSQVYPTMLKLMGIRPKDYAGLFPSMLYTDITREYDFDNSSYSETKNDNLKLIYDIEEMMIRSGYFGTIQ